MLINIAIFVSENFSVAKHWLLRRRRMHCRWIVAIFYLCHNSQAILFFPTLKFSLEKFLFISHLPFVFFCVVKCLRAEPKSRCWSQVYAITLTLQNTRMACNCDCKRKLAQLCANVFLMCKFGVEPLKNDTAAITLHTQSESQHAMRILDVESAFYCMLARERKTTTAIGSSLQCHRLTHVICVCIYFLTFIEK